MLEINKLYRDIIMKHYQEPQNWGLSQDKSFISLTHKNISCGDSIVLQIKFGGQKANQKIEDIKYKTQSCAICRASASLMSLYLKNLEINQCLNKINTFLAMINNQDLDETKIEKELLLFKHFCQFQGRRVCVALPWQALEKIIQKNR
ncbi:NifU homolog [Candidatus Phytoplasma australiense]|uniref:NifU homolog n=2 Tax=Phytoplasma australiense TaxID=59748 RepID=B1VAA5_PHYAS|nr:SUF system NifU family Fe-S cluster assembly protein [Candidatus Phytoplasma australiense]AGL90262.1 NifU-like protein [Strawberry lethal yellows phytoplasma (CPA) str. NZSb11]CAM11878.1 NifU homolog [Candidatus Phytoplasma australiense]